jgi:hypothetical protein
MALTPVRMLASAGVMSVFPGFMSLLFLVVQQLQYVAAAFAGLDTLQGGFP